METLIGASIVIISYLLGSIPFGLLLTQWREGKDLRSLGSGNIGATNVLRTGNKWLALSTLLADAFKGVVAVWIAQSVSTSEVLPVIAGLVAILGHIFPVWLNFKGGKGVATTIAVYAVLWWPLFIAIAITWLSVFFITRISSLAAIIAMIVAMVWAGFLISSVALFMTLVTGSVVIYRHKENIMRLMRGEERGFKKASS